MTDFWRLLPWKYKHFFVVRYLGSFKHICLGLTLSFIFIYCYFSEKKRLKDSFLERENKGKLNTKYYCHVEIQKFPTLKHLSAIGN